MHPDVAKALESLVGPLLTSGLSLGIAERIAKIQAFNSESYPGETCSKCKSPTPILWPWDPHQLCYNCHANYQPPSHPTHSHHPHTTNPRTPD